MPRSIGILTAGGDSPGLNAAIRGVGKAAIGRYDMHVVGFQQGFRGLAEDRTLPLTRSQLSGILTIGGTILGTSRDKPHRVQVGNKIVDMTDAIVETYKRHHLDAVVCLGGGGTQRNAYRLLEAGLNIITLPKTIDNDVAETDVTFGFDTALGIATDAIDRLHSTAHSHHRIIVVEVMGHNAGWLALGAGVAGGADVILIPEIPYDIEAVAESIRHRSRTGSRFSIVAISEGAMSADQARELQAADDELARLKRQKKDSDKTDDTADEERSKAKTRVAEAKASLASNTMHLSERLEEMTGHPVPEGAIYHFSSRRRRVVPITDNLRMAVIETAQAVRAMLAAERLPPPTTDRKLCRGCSLYDLCQPEMLASTGTIAELRRTLFTVEDEPCDNC